MVKNEFLIYLFPAKEMTLAWDPNLPPAHINAWSTPQSFATEL
jgi:hypothetical protein